MPTSIASPPKVVTISACMPPRGRRAVRRVVADQQVGEDRGQLPEDVEHQEVVGEDQAEHRAGEGEKLPANGAKAGSSSVKYQRAVDQHERADTGDHQHQHPLQGPHRERQLEMQRRNPADELSPGRPVRDRAGPGTRTPESGRGNQRNHQESASTEGADQGRRGDGGHEVRKHQG